ncbi:MAG: GAF domain-containing protein [Kofleriaceae bacterium]
MTNTEQAQPRSLEQATMELESEADRQAFLARAGRTLLSSLDYQETLQKLADLAVPLLGDWCAVDMVRADGGYARLAVAHSDPHKVQLAHELWERYPPRPTDPIGLPNVIRTGVPEMLGDLPAELLEASAQDPEHLAIIKSLGLKAYMVLPLTAKGTVLGALTLVQAESGRSYRDDELPFAAEFARLAAIAVDNARLFEGQIEARARAEASEETFRTFIDNLPGLAWTALADGYIDFYNRRWYEYTGTTFEEMQGWGWEKVHDPAFLPTVTSRWKASIETGDPFEMEFPLIGANMLPRWFLTRVNPLRDKTGKIVRWFGTNTDIDDIRSARALAEEMATQSHDTAKELLELRRQKERAEHRVAQLEAEITNRRS